MKKPVLAAVAFIAVVLGVILYTTFGGSNTKYRVEICMMFQGRSECRTASAATHNEALRMATDTACSMIASGQSETERCRNSPPTSEKWLSGE